MVPGISCRPLLPTDALLEIVGMRSVTDALTLLKKLLTALSYGTALAVI